VPSRVRPPGARCSVDEGARRVSRFGGILDAMHDSRSLGGRRALVTGASSGFGEAIARRLAAEGCHLVVSARRVDRLERLAAECRDAHGVEALALPFDVRDRAGVVEALSERAGLLEGLDILVNNAGLALALDPVQSGDPDDWDQMIDTNVKGLLYVTRTCLPHLIANAGDVVNIGNHKFHTNSQKKITKITAKKKKKK
jgi:NADP-dependent 3-hydroxy acid dehydrogenase YdfG